MKFGLPCLGPIIVNILACHQFVARDGILQPLLPGIAALSAYLVWAERRAWKSLVH